MAVTTEHFYSGNNSTTTFAYTFPYYQTSDIKVKVGGTLKTESTHYNVTGTNIVFTSGNVPPTGTNNIHIYRDTDVDTSKATFAAGSSIRATDLNNNHLQLLYHAQERTFNTLQTGDIATAEGKGQLLNANISDTAAIAGTKISPNFGAQNIITTGTAATGAATVTGNITVSGTVDGRDVAADGTKLDGIEAGATGDQTNAEIRAAVEAASDSNVFTDADHTKLNAIETSATADQTGAEIKAAYEAESNTNAYTDAEKTKLAGVAASANNYSISSDLLDEDNMATNSATKVPSQQSVKAYVDANAGGANQNAFSNVAVSGQTTVAADSTTDTLTLAGGSNVTITTNDSTDTVTIAASGGEVTVQDEGSSLSTAATTLNFVGAGVTASGTGATKTITISGSGVGTSTDFKYLELKAHNNASGAFSAGAADYELVTKGTTTAITPSAANALLISIAGVLQEPNTGTSIGSNDGFCIDGSSIHFGANLTAHPDFILYLQGAGVASINDNTVTSAKIVDGTIVNADINASAAIAGSKLADDSIAEAKLDIHNAPSGTDKYLKYTSNGMEWATAGSGTPEGTAILSTGETGGTKFLREDGDNSCSWQTVNTTPEGTAILSTGETGTAKFLRVDGDNSCSWQVPPDTNTQLSTEQVQDIVGAMFTGNTETNITATYEDSDGTIDLVSTDTNTQLSTEEVQDIVGAMFSGNTETNITATYEDSDGTIDLVSTDTVYTHPNHSGEVTSTADGATVIADDIVDEANLKVSNAPTNGYVLTARSGNTGGMTWEATQAPSFEIFEHANALSANKTIGTNNNALVAGPFSTGSYTLTIPSGSVFTVV